MSMVGATGLELRFKNGAVTTYNRVTRFSVSGGLLSFTFTTGGLFSAVVTTEAVFRVDELIGWLLSGRYEVAD